MNNAGTLGPSPYPRWPESLRSSCRWRRSPFPLSRLGCPDRRPTLVQGHSWPQSWSRSASCGVESEEMPSPIPVCCRFCVCSPLQITDLVSSESPLLKLRVPVLVGLGGETWFRYRGWLRGSGMLLAPFDPCLRPGALLAELLLVTLQGYESLAADVAGPFILRPTGPVVRRHDGASASDPWTYPTFQSIQ